MNYQPWMNSEDREQICNHIAGNYFPTDDENEDDN